MDSYILVFIIIIVLLIIISRKKEEFQNQDTIKEQTIAYVINLDERPDRWRKVLQDFKDSSLLLERFPAVKDSVGWKGCGLSHTELIQMAKDNHMDTILIMEDDCKPTEHFNTNWPLIKNWLDSNKDKWDIFIGGNTFYQSVFTTGQDKKLNTIKPICSIENRIKLYNTKLLCLHFYYLNKSVYDKFLDWRKDIDKNGAIDVWPNILNMKVISCVPFIAVQNDDYSNIENKKANYTNSFSGSEQVIASIQNNSVC